MNSFLQQRGFKARWGKHSALRRAIPRTGNEATRAGSVGISFPRASMGAGGHRWRRRRREGGAGSRTSRSAPGHPAPPPRSAPPVRAAQPALLAAAPRNKTLPPDEPRGHSGGAPAAPATAFPRPPLVSCPRYLPHCSASPDLSSPGERGWRSPDPPPPAPLLPAGWLPGQLSSSQRCSATPTTQGHSSTSQFRIGRRSRRPLPLRADLCQRRRRATARLGRPRLLPARPGRARLPRGRRELQSRPGQGGRRRRGRAAAAAYSPHNAAGREGARRFRAPHMAGGAGERPAARSPHGVRLSETARLSPAAGETCLGNRYSIIRWMPLLMCRCVRNKTPFQNNPLLIKWRERFALAKACYGARKLFVEYFLPASNMLFDWNSKGGVRQSLNCGWIRAKNP